MKGFLILVYDCRRLYNTGLYIINYTSKLDIQVASNLWPQCISQCNCEYWIHTRNLFLKAELLGQSNVNLCS